MNAENEPATFRGWEYAKRGDYHRKVDPNWSYAPTYHAKMRQVRAFLDDLPPNAGVLDAGCGEGVLTEEYRARGYRIEGLDLNYESEFVRRGTVTSMPDYEDEQFGAILFLDVFEHLPFEQQPTALRELRRVLRPSGTLLMSIPNLAHFESRFRFALLGNLDRSDSELEHIGERPLKENLRLIREAGLRVERIAGVTLSIPVLYRGVICRWPRRMRRLHDALDHIAVPSLSLLNLFWCRRTA